MMFVESSFAFEMAEYSFMETDMRQQIPIVRHTNSSTSVIPYDISIHILDAEGTCFATVYYYNMYQFLDIVFPDAVSNEIALIFQPNDSIVYVYFDIIDNVIVEEDKIIHLSLVTPDGNMARTAIHIVDDDGKLKLCIQFY